MYRNLPKCIKFSYIILLLPWDEIVSAGKCQIDENVSEENNITNNLSRGEKVVEEILLLSSVHKNRERLKIVTFPLKPHTG